jgi:hypothetical protein
VANSIFSAVKTTLAKYIASDKADATLERNLTKVGATPDTLTKDNLAKIIMYLTAAVELGSDKSKAAAAEKELKALAS